MTEICNIVIVNGLLAAGLAIAVAVVCSRICRPSVRHILWVLVLLRLLMPPVLEIDLTAQRNRMSGWIANCIEFQQAEARFVWQKQFSAMQKAAENVGLLPLRSLYVSDTDDDCVLAETRSDYRSRFDFSAVVRRAWAVVATVLLGIWLAGSLWCLSHQLFVALHFQKRLRRHSYKSSIWQRRANRLAVRMGLPTSPPVRFVRDAISPMLWGVGGRVVILLPDRLLERLDRRSQNALLAHELAHYQRGDHWIRLVESIATIVYWWHPVLWWVRHEIEKAEEPCCDAIAVKWASGYRRGYAEALLATVDFVSEPALPPTASGACRNGILRRRIELIMLGRGVASKRRFGPAVLLLVAAVLLPFPVLFGETSAGNDCRHQESSSRPPSLTNNELASESSMGSYLPREARLETDPCHRSILFTRNGSVIDLGTGRVRVATWSGSTACPDSRALLALGMTDGSIEIRSSLTGDRLAHRQLGHAAIVNANFSADGRTLAVEDQNGEHSMLKCTPGSDSLFSASPKP